MFLVLAISPSSPYVYTTFEIEYHCSLHHVGWSHFFGDAVWGRLSLPSWRQVICCHASLWGGTKDICGVLHRSEHGTAVGAWNKHWWNCDDCNVLELHCILQVLFSHMFRVTKKQDEKESLATLRHTSNSDEASCIFILKVTVATSCA